MKLTRLLIPVALFLLILTTANAQVNILVTYYSKSGNTKKMAEAIGEGAKSVEGTTVVLKSLEETKAEDLKAAHGIIVGCPVYMGTVPPAVLEKLMEWPAEGTKNKVGAVFVTAGSISSGEELTQVALLLQLISKGMLVVGGPHFSVPFGVSAITRQEPFGTKKPDDIAKQFLDNANALGKKVAEISKKVK